MKCALIVLCALMYASKSEAKWCLQNITTYISVSKVLTRTKSIFALSIPPRQTIIETYRVIESIPSSKEQRMCCSGYIMAELDHACVPMCSAGCPEKADCVEPEVCKCHPGYHIQDGVCQLLNCENCENGRCTETGGCECNPMYVPFEGVCKPICRSKCINGFCSAPNRCECNIGYQPIPETDRCEPICSPFCGGNAYCSSPYVCSCKYGFFGNASDVCQPWCKTECKNGECIGPNNCACHQGFVKVEGLCIPDCQSGCMFGDCMDEGVCHCWEGYVYNNATGSCQESLDLPSHPMTTSTIYKSTSTASIPTTNTRSPYTSAASHTTPDPLCLNSCGNGTCISGSCHCAKGFIKAGFLCSFTCGGCKIGDCVADVLCERFSRMQAPPLIETTTDSTLETSSIYLSSTEFISSTTERFTDCDKGCWAGTCVNGTCQCSDGLILNEENDCIMPCEATCKNGICTQDKVCECRAGYEYNNATECVPQCDNECVHSFCIAPNHCACHEGYIPSLDLTLAHVCLPTCNSLDGEEGCLNGTCIAVNKCQCLKGFEHKPGNRFECIPIVEYVRAEKAFDGLLYVYLLLGLLILLVMAILGLYALRKMHQDSYNVDKVEKNRGTVRYKNGEHIYCII